MKNFAVKRTISNTRNCDIYTEWHFSETEEEREDWINSEKEKQDEWNYRTPGAVSTRYYDFTKYDINSLKNLTLADLAEFTIQDFLELFKHFLTEKESP